jgi:uncharacterized protein YbbC (DUF1343 family)
MVITGLERLLGRGHIPGSSADDAQLAPLVDELRRARLGLVVHPASVTSDLVHAADALASAGFDLRALFGPQHGARGEKQDNMIESDPFVDARTGLPVHSLYGEVRKPTPEMLHGLDALLFDLQDVGVRIYTFVWTMALAMEACAEVGVRFVVLDRPNPIGGRVTEGPVLREGFESFVGLHPVPMRHGLTAGELARWLVGERGIDCRLDVIPCDGWSRDHWWDETGLPWVLPSPNLPTPDSCAIYPGMVLMEGTNLSEGRGTTRPFEMFGAPYLEPYALTERLESAGLAGVRFRPCYFEPTFQKHAGRLCGGAQLHVTDRGALRSVRVAVEILRAARDLAPDAFAFIPPPYEYETEKMPIDILWGGDGLRLGIESGAGVDRILGDQAKDLGDFDGAVNPYRLYD